MLSCKEAGLLIEKDQEGQLGVIGKWRLKRHLLICDLCKTYQKQSAALNRLLQKEVDNSLGKLNKEDLKAKIINQIKREGGEL